MNNQRNNNRRRGRGNNRGGGNGGNQGNRIDSRARGNAPQLLEKYRKLAQEASLNDDRVQTEYYLQFADHYFRVIADGRAQKDDGRPQRRDAEQGYDGDDFEDEREDFREVGREGSRDQGRDNTRDNRDQGRDQARDGNRDGGRDGARESGRDGGREDRPRQQQPRRRDAAEGDAGERGETPFEVRPGAEGDEDDGENPFAANTSRRKRTSRRKDAGNEPEIGLDPGLLPPSIGRSNVADDTDEDEAPAAPASEGDGPAATPRRRLKMPRARSGDEEELVTAD